MDYFKHHTTEVSDKAKIGKGTKLWHYVQISDKARIGENCIFGKSVYVGVGVQIGNNVKVQNRASLYKGSIIEDGVFIGPNVCLLNDKFPRAINKDGSLKQDHDWELKGVTIKEGASIGAGAIILPGVTVGKHAMIGAGSVVTKDIPDFRVCYGNPARIKGRVRD